MNQVPDSWRPESASTTTAGEVNDASALRSDPRLALKLGGVLVLWLVLRVVFFEGLWGYDDLYHVQWATRPRVPVDVWEARLLFNGMLWLSRAAFGFNEWAFALPTLLSSLAMTLTAWWAARRLWGDAAGLLAAFLATACAGDVIRASDPMANPLGAAFAGLGTALLVVSHSRRSRVAAGVALGLSTYSHLATLFYVLPVVGAYAVHDWPRPRWREALLVLFTAGAVNLGLEMAVFGLISGHPLLHVDLLRHTHLEIQEYTINPHLPDGSWNPEWFTWPFATFLFSKDFGFLISLPALVALATWRRQSQPTRFLTAAVVMAWAWLNFGVQHPFKYAPLDHQTRYWHALLVPAVVLAVHVCRQIRPGTWRRAYLAALALPMPLLLVSSGPWGQNVEITRELMAYADAHPDQTFATDPYTYDEMFILDGCEPPKNVTLLRGYPDNEYDKPAERLDPNRPDLQVLFNPLNMGRVRTADFERLIDKLRKREIAPQAYRLIAYVLPQTVRDSHAWFVRRPPAWLAVPP
jgi:hypothetical protein